MYEVRLVKVYNKSVYSQTVRVIDKNKAHFIKHNLEVQGVQGICKDKDA